MEVKKSKILFFLCLLLFSAFQISCSPQYTSQKTSPGKNITEKQALSLVKNYESFSMSGKTIQDIVHSKDTRPIWSSKQNPEGKGFFVAVEYDLAGFTSKPLAIWWVSPNNQIYWENGTAKDLTADFLKFSPRNKDKLPLMDVVDLFR